VSAEMTCEKDTECDLPLSEKLELNNPWRKLAFLVRIPLKEEERNALERVNFHLHYENERFTVYASIFNFVFIIATVLALYSCLKKLRGRSYGEWLVLHKWIVILLIVQLLFNDPFTFLNKMYENKLWMYLSEFFKTFYICLMLYFWLSVFDTILIENLSDRFFTNYAQKFKAFIIIVLFTNMFSFNSYILFMEYENEYDELFEEKATLASCRNVIMGAQIVYLVYFIILTMLYLKMAYKGVVPADRSANILYICSIIVFVFTTINVIKDDLQNKEQSTLEYLAFHGILSVYVIMLSKLYMPLDGNENDEIEFEMRKEQDQIFREVYGEEEGNVEETKTNEGSSSRDQEHKKKKSLGQNPEKFRN